MADLRFEWDPRKASANETKHGVSFDEASTVFRDQNGWIYYDPDHLPPESRQGRDTILFRETIIMRRHYDFSTLKGRRNPFAKRLKKQISIRIGIDTLEYFKNMSRETGVPYQNLIDSYLADCADKNRKLRMKWG